MTPKKEPTRFPEPTTHYTDDGLYPANGRKICGSSPAMLQLYLMLDRIADTNATVLIEGETGTGKELAAKSLHFNSRRKDSSYIPVDCSSVPETLLDSYLFGHVNGAFTGANGSRKGVFEQAGDGTILLDEIQNLTPDAQAKLLRVLQERTYTPVGGQEPKECNARIVVATNGDLEALVNDGKFRKDLFHRINVIPVKIPALRERKEDIPQLVEYFLERYNQEEHGTNTTRYVKGVTPEAMSLLMAYTWSGNVRELEQVIHQRVILNEYDMIRAEDLPKQIREYTPDIGTVVSEAVGGGNGTITPVKPINGIRPLKDLVREAEISAIQNALMLKHGHLGNTAEALGLSRKGLSNKIDTYGIDVKSYK